MPLLGKLDRTDAGDALSPKQTSPAVGSSSPVSRLTKRRLAGAVRADDGDELVGCNGDADVLQRVEFAESFADPAGLEESVHACARRIGRSMSGMAAIPPGKPMTMMARIAPRMKRQYCVRDWS